MADPSELELRAQAEATTGIQARERRIAAIEYRRDGCDKTSRVGESSDSEGPIVLAIFQVGRDAYTIHHRQGGRAPALPLVLSRSDVYSVTELD